MDYQVIGGIIILLLLLLLFSISHYQNVKMDNYHMTRHIREKSIYKKRFIERFDSLKPVDGLQVIVEKFCRDPKVKWGYLCPQGTIGSVCSTNFSSNVTDQIENATTATQLKDLANQSYRSNMFQQLRDVGVNVISLFCNIWQPKAQSDMTTFPNNGTDWYTQSINNLGDFTWSSAGLAPQVPKLTGYGLEAQKVGIIPLLTIGSWDAIFPINNDLYEGGVQCNAVVGTNAPQKWELPTDIFSSPPEPKKVADALIKKATEIGCVGFDFDIEGFGGGGNACNASNDAFDYSNPNTTSPFIMPDAVTIKFLNDLFTELRSDEYGKPPAPPSPTKTIDQWIITVVPTSISLYTSIQQNAEVPQGKGASFANPAQNQLAYLNFKNINGVLLQWYSGFGSNVCKDVNGKQVACDGGVYGTECSDKPSNGLKTISKTQPTWWTSEKAPADEDGWYPLNDNISQKFHKDKAIIVSRQGMDKTKCGNLNLSPNATCPGMSCPYKCPRKSDCPDWSYERSAAFKEQLAVLAHLNKIPGLTDQIYTKVCIGLEGFPNLKGTYQAVHGTKQINHQFWGPLPSAYAVCGLNEAAKRANYKGIAGVGMFTVNNAFLRIDALDGPAPPGPDPPPVPSKSCTGKVGHGESCTTESDCGWYGTPPAGYCMSCNGGTCY
jgi:hypothetical protein